MSRLAPNADLCPPSQPVPQNTSNHPIMSPAAPKIDPERQARRLVPRRYPRELSLDEVEVVGDRGEVGARQVDLSQY
jgi:hypothetical protein